MRLSYQPPQQSKKQKKNAAVVLPKQSEIQNTPAVVLPKKPKNKKTRAQQLQESNQQLQESDRKKSCMTTPVRHQLATCQADMAQMTQHRVDLLDKMDRQTVLLHRVQTHTRLSAVDKSIMAQKLNRDIGMTN